MATVKKCDITDTVGAVGEDFSGVKVFSFTRTVGAKTVNCKLTIEVDVWNWATQTDVAPAVWATIRTKIKEWVNTNW